MKNCNISFLVLDFRKEFETRTCLESIRKYALFDYQIIYLDNGGYDESYPNVLYDEGLCDVIIRKKSGMGGGYGQTDLIRYCPTDYFFFIQNDQALIQEINENHVKYFIELLNHYQCIDLNGDQSRKGIWTDRAHFMKTSLFNSLAPFPNGGPGLDDIKWNEQYLQEQFITRGYKIAHLNPAPFQDCGKWSIREAGDGLYKHRCDTKQMYILKKPTYITKPYPPFDEQLEWPKVLNGDWRNGDIPLAWKSHSFQCWPS